MFLSILTMEPLQLDMKGVLNRLLLALEAAPNIDDAMGLCLTIAMDVVGMECGGIYLRDDSGNYRLACFKGLSPEFVEKNRFHHKKSERIKMLKCGLPLFAEYKCMNAEGLADICQEGLHSFVAIPIMYKGQMISILNFASRTYDEIPKLCYLEIEALIPQMANVLARLYAEAQWRRAQELFAIAFQNSPQWITITSLKEGVFVEVNEGFCSMLGYRREEVIGKNLIELGISTPESRAGLTGAIIADGEVKNLETSFVKKDGTILKGLISARLIDLSGEPCLVSVVTDITELRGLESRLARLDRLNLVGEISASIGHEIRNPMTVVRGFLQILGSKEEYAGDREYFELMIEELDRANAILTEFLSLAKNKRANFSSRNLNDVIAAISPLIRAAALAQDLTLQLELKTVPHLCIDEKEIRQMVINLAQNGLEAMDAGGVLSIKTRLDGSQVILSVEDEGRGIDASLLDRLGTPFQTTKENGTGLGLAVCYSIADRHNGEIRVETSSSGTVIEVLFPIP